MLLIAVSPRAKAGYVSTGAYSHYSLLRTLEEGFGLAPLGNAGKTSAMSDLWK